MTSLERFQSEHGQSWGELIGTPAFGAALALANAEKIQKIIALTDDEIATKGHVILADLRGHLTYEAAILALHEKKSFVFQQLGSEEYPDPVEEARLEDEREARGEQSDESEDTSITSSAFTVGGPTVQEQLFPNQKKLIAADKRRSERAAKKKLSPKRKPRKIRK